MQCDDWNNSTCRVPKRQNNNISGCVAVGNQTAVQVPMVDKACALPVNPHTKDPIRPTVLANSRVSEHHPINSQQKIEPHAHKLLFGSWMSSPVHAEKLKAAVANKQRQFGLTDTATLPQQPLLTQCELDESNDTDQVSRSSSRGYAC